MKILMLEFYLAFISTQLVAYKRLRQPLCGVRDTLVI